MDERGTGFYMGTGGDEELSKEELKEKVAEGLFFVQKNHKEHLALHPFWLTKIQEGIAEDIGKTLGRWHSKLKGYVVGFEDASCATESAALNEDHKWIHIDVIATFYLYQPTEGQQVKGVIKKIGRNAVVVTIFNVFSASVFASVEELGSYSIGDEIRFQITSVMNRRKGPVMRGSTEISGESPKKSKKKKREKVQLPEMEDWETEDIAVDESPAKKSKKKKKEKPPEMETEIWE